MENRPVLKKVRRPINRVMPTAHSEGSNETDFTQSEVAATPTAQTAPTPQAPEVSVNLPSVNKHNTNQYNNFNQSFDEEPQFIEDEYTDSLYENEKRGVSAIALVFSIILSLAVGLLMGKLLFSESQVTHNGLQGVVVNNEVPRGRARCGVADRTQGCVLYIMNPQRQNVRAKDFYDMAAQVTGRQRFMVETGNMRYSNTEIRPGDIAQLNIPPL